MSKNTKFKQHGIVTLLIVICAVLIGLIYTSTQGKDDNVAAVATDEQAITPVVKDINVDETAENNAKNGESSGVIVEQIDPDQDDVVEVNVDNEAIEVSSIDREEAGDTEVDVIVIEEIVEPQAEVPDKPDTTPPEEQPVTDDDLTNPDVVPEYDEAEVTYVPDTEPEEEQDEVRGSNLVPDSENPFLQDNIPGNGDGGESLGEDLYQDGVPSGEGDKF